MTYEEVIEKIRSTTKVSVVSVKDIQARKKYNVVKRKYYKLF